MRIKRYVGMNVQEALKRIKEELGPEALILNTRKLPRRPRLPFLNFLMKERIEVLAASGEEGEGVEGGRLESKYLRPSTSGGAPLERSSLSERELFLERELREIKEVLAGIASRGGDEVPFDGKLREIYNRLLDAEVDRDLARALVDAAQDPPEGINALSRGPASPPEGVSALPREAVSPDVKGLYNARFSGYGGLPQVSPEERVLARLEAMMSTSGAIQISPGLRKSVVLVGPTGVGKTTTLAKLAGHFALFEKRRVALITADRYRIAAVEQLKTYGEIIGIPVEVVYTPSEMRRALARHRDKDLVLVDTAGRSSFPTPMSTSSSFTRAAPRHPSPRPSACAGTPDWIWGAYPGALANASPSWARTGLPIPPSCRHG